MKVTAWLTVTVAALTGCATIDATECQKAYDVGFRDAIFGLQRQDPIYAPLCSAQGTQLGLGFLPLTEPQRWMGCRPNAEPQATP